MTVNVIWTWTKLLTPPSSLRRYRYTNGDWGSVQNLGDTIVRTKVKPYALAMNKYAVENVTTYPLSLRIQCTNSNPACLEWASLNECETNLNYMITSCPLACRLCDKRLLYDKCKNDNPTNPWLPEDGLKELFEHLKSQGQPELLTEVKDPDSPWILKWDDFVSSRDASDLLALAKGLTWEDSRPVESTNHNRVRRLSQSAYCKDCPTNNGAYQKLQRSLATLVQADLKYMEPFEFVHYQKMQSYGAHHDMSLHDLWLPAGPPVLSIFLCLSDVPQGGAMGFPDLDWLFIPPKKGQLLIWPNVLNSDLKKVRKDMSNEALPVLEGEKYGIHTWVRLYDYEEAERQGCV
jgi:ShK domain-like